MVLSASASAVVVGTTVGYALIAPFLADEVREGQGVLGHVGCLAIIA